MKNCCWPPRHSSPSISKSISISPGDQWLPNLVLPRYCQRRSLRPVLANQMTTGYSFPRLAEGWAPHLNWSNQRDHSWEVIRKYSLVLSINQRLLRKAKLSAIMYTKDLLWWFDLPHLWELVKVLAGSFFCLGAEPEVIGRAGRKKRWTWPGEQQIQLKSECVGHWHLCRFLPDSKSATSLLSITHISGALAVDEGEERKKT